MRKLAAAAITLVMLGFLLYRGLAERSGPLGTADNAALDTMLDDPLAPAQDRVRGLLEAARAGDVEKYLSAFSGSLRERLAREAEEKGRSAFSKQLREAAMARKSHAQFAPETDGEESVQITVESVYPDRNERQKFRVEKVDGDWFITSVETVRSHQPASKFGTLATFEGPEGVPVPVAEKAGVAPSP